MCIFFASFVNHGMSHYFILMLEWYGHLTMIIKGDAHIVCIVYGINGGKAENKRKKLQKISHDDTIYSTIFLSMLVLCWLLFLCALNHPCFYFFFIHARISSRHTVSWRNIMSFFSISYFFLLTKSFVHCELLYVENFVGWRGYCFCCQWMEKNGRAMVSSVHILLTQWPLL